MPVQVFCHEFFHVFLRTADDLSREFFSQNKQPHDRFHLHAREDTWDISIEQGIADPWCLAAWVQRDL